MALVLADRVKDTTTTTGTGAVTLSGSPPAGFQPFSVIGNGNVTYYAISGGSQWEVGIGTYSSTGPTLTRDTVFASSNAGSLVDLAAGAKDVFVTYPAEKSVNYDVSGNVNIDITGNAATVTNGVYTNGSYSDPAWIVTLAGSKISGNISGNAGGLSATLGVSSGGTGITSLTAGYLPKGNGTSAFATSIIYDNGTNVGINNSTPTARLDVGGDINATSLALATALSPGSGGTGLSSFTSGGAVYANSISTLTTGTLPVSAGGTGGATQSDARTGLGLGSIATQAASSVAITGGYADGVVIGANTAANATFVNVAATNATFTDATTTNVTATTGVFTNASVQSVPSAGTDVANKAYVDIAVSSGLHIHTPVYVESPTALNAIYADGGTTPTWTTITTNREIATGSAHGLSVGDVIVFTSTTNGLTSGTPYFVYSTPTSTSITLSLSAGGAQITSLTNGTGLSIGSRANSGVGATLTNNGTLGVITVDGVALSNGQRVLVYQQSNGFQNGVYTVTTAGDGSTAWVLTRASDANKYGVQSTDYLGSGDYFFVQEGSTGAGESYVLTTTGTIVFGTTDLTFTQFSSSQVYDAGTGLTLTNTTFSLTNPVDTSLGGTGLASFTSGGAVYATSTSALTTGTLPVTAGGTGQTSFTNGQLLIGNTTGNTLTKATLTAGSNINITNGTGSITIGTTGLMPLSAINALGNQSGSISIDVASYDTFSVTLTGNLTISSFTNLPTNPYTFTIITVQDATGGRSITWPTGTKYAGGVTPPITTTANAIDIWTVYTYNSGSSYVVSLAVKDAK